MRGINIDPSIIAFTNTANLDDEPASIFDPACYRHPNLSSH